jgi:hypothetical protein
VLGAEAAAFGDVPLQDLAPLGRGRGDADAALGFLGADGSEGVVEGLVSVAHLIEVAGTR